MDIKQQRKIGIQYSVGQIATLVLELMAAYALFYMTTTKLVAAAPASTIMSVCAIVAAIVGLYIGYVADRSKKGKRFIAFTFLIPTLIAFVMFFAPFDFGSGNLAYLGVVMIIFYGCYYCFLTPFDALGGEIVTDYNVRTFMRTLCVAGIYVGVIFADTLSTYIRTGLMSGGMSDAMSWFVMAIILAVVSALAGLFAFKATKGHGGPAAVQEDAPKTNIIKSYIQVFRIKPICVLTIWTILFYIVCMIMSPMILYYGVYVLGLSQAAASTLYLVAVAVTLAFTPFAPMITQKFGKKAGIYIGFFVYAAFAIYIILAKPTGMVPGAIFAGTYSIVNTISQGVSYSMLYDSAEVAEFKTGESQQATAMGLMKCAMAIGLALGTFLLGQILSIGGFDGAVLEQSAKTVSWITSGVTYIPAIILLLSALVILVGYKVNERNHEALVAAMEAKAEGKEYSTDGFEELL